MKKDHSNIIIDVKESEKEVSNLLSGDPPYSLDEWKEKFVKFEEEEAVIGEHSLSWWVEKYGLPLHINYSPIIKKNIKEFQRVIEKYYPQTHIRYAAKAYCHSSIFRIVRDEGLGVDVSSGNEYRAAKESGIAPDLFVLNGNSREDSLLQEAIQDNATIVLDHPDELPVISRIAEQLGKNAIVIIRVCGFEMEQATDECILTSGLWTKFGVELFRIPSLIETLYDYPYVDVVGFHMHIGSQISEIESYLFALGKLIEMGHLLNKSGGRCRILDIGGGFPISYLDQDQWIELIQKIRKGYFSVGKGDGRETFAWANDITGFSSAPSTGEELLRWTGEKFYSDYTGEKMLEAIFTGDVTVDNCSLNTVQALKDLGEVTLFIEPGRSIVGEAGITLARVNHTKKVAVHHNMIILEMGVVNHAGSVIHPLVNRWGIATYPLSVEADPYEAFVCGNLCYNGDIIARYKITLPRKPVRGDILIIYDTGGTESHFFASNANSFPRPARLLVDEKGNVEEIHLRETYEEIFN